MFQSNPDSVLIFLSDSWSIAIVNIVLQSPVEYGANGPVGLIYNGVKDFIKWATPDGYDKKEILKSHISLIMNLGAYYMRESNRKK